MSRELISAAVSWWTLPMSFEAFTARAAEESPRIHASKEGLTLAIWTSDSESRPIQQAARPADDRS